MRRPTAGNGPHDSTRNGPVPVSTPTTTAQDASANTTMPPRHARGSVMGTFTNMTSVAP